MGSLASLNSYSSSNTVMTVNDQSVYAVEGASVEMPLMAWTPIHDIGNSLVANGIAVTHRLHDPMYTLSDGTELTQAEYNTWANVHLPTLTSYSGNVTGSTVQTKYKSKSMLYQAARQYYSGSYDFIGTGPFTVDTWAYFDPTSVSGRRFTHYYEVPVLFDHDGNYSIHYTKNNSSALYQALEDLWIFVDNGGTTSYYRIDLLSLGVSIYRTWAHIACLRLGSTLEVFINGTKRQVDYYGTTWPTFYGQNPVGPVTANVSITDTVYHTGNIYMNWSSATTSTTMSRTYIDQLRVSNIGRYSGANFTPPTSAMTYDSNTIVLLEWDQTANAVVQVAEQHWPYLDSNPIVFPPITLDRVGSNPNVTLTQDTANTWTISGIRTPEDYLQGAGFLNFPPDYYGNLGNANLNGTGSWTTNIRNTGVAAYDYTYDVNLTLENTNELTPSSLANILYTSDSSQTLTSLQVPRITDFESTTSNAYTLTATTQSSTAKIQLSAGNVANLTTNSFDVYGSYGRLTLVGPKEGINTALANVVFTTSSNATANMTAVASGNSSSSSDSVFTAIGTQPNYYVGNNVGSLNFTGSTGSSGGLVITSDTNTNSIQTWLGDRTNPATLEFWCYDAYDESTSKLICDFGYRSGGVNQQLTRGKNTGITYWNWVVNGSTVASKAIGLTGWHHTAFVRGSSAMRWYVDGTLVASIAYPTYELLMNLPIFGQSSGSNGLVGKLDEFRISNSARYVADFGTTPAINRLDSAGVLKPLEVDTNTLALWRMDTGTYPNYYTDTRYTVYDTGYITWQSTNPYGLVSSISGLYKNEDTP